MSATLTIISWRDIPAQVTAKSEAGSARAELSERFQKAIDAAAMKAGLVDMDLYLEEWRQETRACGDDLDAEVAAEVKRLETEFSRDVLLELTRSGGLLGEHSRTPRRRRRARPAGSRIGAPLPDEETPRCSRPPRT
jgi:hypothetical protein